MKKIKGILLFGILTLLGIGSSFGNELDQVNHLSVFNKLGYGFVDLSCSFYNCSAPGLINGTIHPSGSYDRLTYMVFLLKFNKGGGFELSGYSSNYGRYVRLMTVPPLSSLPVINDPLGPTQDVNPGSGEDIPPLIFDSSLNYFTFSYANQLMYNGQSFYNLSVGNNYQLEYCFYGLNYSLSCVYKNLENSLDYKFFHFNLNLNTLQFEENSGFIIDPVSGTNYSFVYSFDSQNRIMYNIYNGQSDSVSDFSSFDVIDKGYIDVTSLTFLNRSYISDLDLGYFGDIVYNSGNFYFQSNSVLFVDTGDNDFLESSPALVLYQDSSVPNILGGNSSIGNQSTGSIAINTGLLNLCLNDLQFGELNSYLCNRLLSNLGNPVQIPGTSGQYISVSIDENGNLRYWITTQEDLAEQMSGFVWNQDENGNWYTTCPSGDCLGTILAKPIIHTGSGEVFEFTTGTVLDMITNLTGWVGRCPFPYTDFRLGKNFKLIQILQDYGFNYDPFIFVNCAVAGFHYGRHSIDRQIFDDTFEHPLLYGDTQKHRSLFVFLDFIVILGLLGLSAFLKRIF